MFNESRMNIQVNMTGKEYIEYTDMKKEAQQELKADWRNKLEMIKHE